MTSELNVHSGLMPHVARRRVGELGLELGNFPRQGIEDALAQRGVRAVCQLCDGLGERGDDLIDVDGISIAARGAVLGVEVVDRVADEAVQARPLFIRFSTIRHGHPRMRGSGPVCVAGVPAAPCTPPAFRNPGGPERTAALKYDQSLTLANPSSHRLWAIRVISRAGKR